MAGLWEIQWVIRKTQWLVAVAVIWFAAAFILESAAAETRNQNRARCKDANSDLSIDACTALIQSGRQNKSGLAEMFSDRGNAYFRKGDYDRAIQDYDQAIQLKPDSAQVFNNRGNALTHMSRFDRAIADYDQATRLRPDYAMAFNNRGIVYDHKGEYNRAIQDYDQAIRLKADMAEVQQSRNFLR